MRGGVKMRTQVEIKEEDRQTVGCIPSERSAFSPSFQSSDSSVRRPLPLVCAATAGLQQMVTNINKRQSPVKGEHGHAKGGACVYDDANGFLQLPGGSVFAAGSLEQLGGRYEVRGLLGMGTFAQILEAEDMMSVSTPRQRVALKVTRAGMQGIGMQESQLLAYLSSCKGFAGANLLRMHAAFPFGEHWVMAVEAMNGYRQLPPLPHSPPFSLSAWHGE